MTIRIYTDASIKAGRGAWACVVLRGADHAEGFGPLRGAFQSSTATELCAIANALHHADRLASLRGETVELWCDNQAAIAHANRTARVRMHLDETIKRSRGWIKAFVARERITFRAHFVRGHQRMDSPDPNALYNLRCDELCSAVRDMMEARPFDTLRAKVEAARAKAARREGAGA